MLADIRSGKAHTRGLARRRCFWDLRRARSKTVLGLWRWRSEGDDLRRTCEWLFKVKIIYHNRVQAERFLPGAQLHTHEHGGETPLEQSASSSNRCSTIANRIKAHLGPHLGHHLQPLVPVSRRSFPFLPWVHGFAPDCCHRIRTWYDMAARICQLNEVHTMAWLRRCPTPRAHP